MDSDITGRPHSQARRSLPQPRAHTAHHYAKPHFPAYAILRTGKNPENSEPRKFRIFRTPPKFRTSQFPKPANSGSPQHLSRELRSLEDLHPLSVSASGSNWVKQAARLRSLEAQAAKLLYPEALYLEDSETPKTLSSRGPAPAPRGSIPRGSQTKTRNS